MESNNQKIGLWSIILLGINGIIGSGIFLLPGKVMQEVGNWGLVVYLCTFVLVLSIAWCFAQCASLFSCNGGAYIYAKEAFGGVIAFEMGLMRCALGIIAWAALAVGFATALSSIWPLALQEPVRSVLVVGLIWMLGLMNCFGVQIFKQLNNLVTVTKLIPILFFIVFGTFYINTDNFSPLMLNDFHIDSFGAAILLVFYAFGGFETLVVAAGEMTNPKKNLPLALMLGIGICSFLYILIQFVAIGLLGSELKNSVSPLADAAHLLFGNIGMWIATLSMLISIGGINIAASFVTPLSAVAIAEDRILPYWFTKKSRFNTPVRAILTCCALTSILALSGSFATLAVISVIARFVQYIVTCFAVIALNRQGKFVDSPNWMYKVIPLLSICGMCCLLCYANFGQLASGLGALILGFPVYWFQKYRKKSIQRATSCSS